MGPLRPAWGRGGRPGVAWAAPSPMCVACAVPACRNFRVKPQTRKKIKRKQRPKFRAPKANGQDSRHPIKPSSSEKRSVKLKAGASLIFVFSRIIHILHLEITHKSVVRRQPFDIVPCINMHGSLVHSLGDCCQIRNVLERIRPYSWLHHCTTTASRLWSRLCWSTFTLKVGSNTELQCARTDCLASEPQPSSLTASAPPAT